MPNFLTASALVESATKCLATACLGADALDEPVAGDAGVGHGFERGEGLGGDDEQRLVGVDACGRLLEVGAVDIGDKADVDHRIAELSERPVSHFGAEIGAADADVDHRADALAAMPLPFARAQLVGKGRHPVEHLVDLGNHVLAVDQDFFRTRRPQRDMQHGAPFADVDLFAGEHRVPALGDAAGAGEIEEQPRRFVGDAVLRIVEEEAGGLGREALGSAGIVGEQGAKRRSFTAS